jgi:cytochrome b561
MTTTGITTGTAASERKQFVGSIRVFHWLAAIIVLVMLGIGFRMVSSLADYHTLISIHRPLGILLLTLVAVRLVNRLMHGGPELPVTMSAQEKFAARASEVLLYVLLFAMPLVGWGMLSAARFPIAMFGSVHLPPILPHSVMLYAILRKTHTALAYLLLFAFIGHFGAVLFHSVVLRDGLFSRMAPWRASGEARN